MRILHARDYRALPWKNGLGVSRIIASQPPEAGYDSLSWQVSTTRIEADCPFSSLPGLDRQFVLLEGGGVELRCRGLNGDPDFRRKLDVPFEPFEFRGDWQTECRLLAGPVQVFNVLTRRSEVTARVSVLAIDGAARLERNPAEALLVFVANGSPEVGETLAMHDAFLLEAPGPRHCTVRAAGNPGSRLLTVHIAPGRSAAGQ